MYEYDDYEEIRRLFDPYKEHAYCMVPADSLVKYNPEKQIMQLRFKAAAKPDLIDLASTIVVNIDGACRDNGKPSARASYGVYFGPGSRYNSSGRLESSIPQTSTRAEIEALSKCLDTIREITDKDFKLSEIKIVTDSKYLVDSFTRWIEDWAENDGCSEQGKKIAHFDTLHAIHKRLDEMEYGDDGGIECQFWLQPRELNREADALANAALDG